MKAGQYDAAFAVFNRFLTRVDERTEIAIEMIDLDHDYTIDEEIVTDSDLLKFPRNNEEAVENWRKRIKYSLLVLKDDENEEKEEEEPKDGDEPEAKPKKKEDPKEILRKRYRSFALSLIHISEPTRPY